MSAWAAAEALKDSSAPVRTDSPGSNPDQVTQAQTAQEPGQSGEPGSLVFQLSVRGPDKAPNTQASPQPSDREFSKIDQAADTTGNVALQAYSGSWNGTGTHDTDHSDSGELPRKIVPDKSAIVDSTFSTSETPIAPQLSLPMPLAQMAHTRTDQPLRAAPSLPDATGPQAQAGPAVRQMGLLIRGVDDQVVRLQISQTNGSVRVAAYSADQALGQHLRASLPDLLDRLDRQGYAPVASTSPLTAADSHNLPSKDFQSGNYGDSTGDQPRPRQQRKQARNAWERLASELHDS